MIVHIKWRKRSFKPTNIGNISAVSYFPIQIGWSFMVDYFVESMQGPPITRIELPKLIQSSTNVVILAQSKN